MREISRMALAERVVSASLFDLPASRGNPNRR
jgi:hypothetical protein